MSKSMSPYLELFIWIGPLVVIPAVVGYVVGRLVGESSTPVVATVLPLVFGLLSVLTLQLARNKSIKEEAITELLGSRVFANTKDDLKKDIEQRVREENAISRSSAVFPLLWTIGIVMFCVTFMRGKDDGIRIRVPQYSAFNFTTRDINSVEFTDLYRLRLYLLGLNVSADEFQGILRDVIEPILVLHSSPERTEALNTAIRRLIGSYDPTKDGRNASTHPSQNQSFDFHVAWQCPVVENTAPRQPPMQKATTSKTTSPTPGDVGGTLRPTPGLAPAQSDPK